MAMAGVHVYPVGDHCSPGRVLHSPRSQRLTAHASSAATSDRCYRSLSLRSLPRKLDAFETDDGAEIPDIPRASSRAEKRRSDSAKLAQILAGSRDFLFGRRRATSSKKAGVEPEGLSEAIGAAMKRATSPEPGGEPSTGTRTPSTYPRSPRSKANSVASTYATTDTSLLPALQTKGAGDEDALEPLLEEDIEPGSFDLVVPGHGDGGLYSLERRSDLLFSKEHLAVIFDDPTLLQLFTSFLCTHRQSSVPLLIYYLDALKALKAISYSNAVLEALEPIEGHGFSTELATATVNESLKAKANASFEALAREDLPAYITHVWIRTVSISIKKRITGTLPAHLRDMSEGLAEVFCLTDPSRHDNPIVFASEEFHRTTQYGMNYVLGRNCRFLQGPKTNPFSVKRIREKVLAGEEHYETFLNYRRDGSPFMNLLMIAPLYDSRGAVRYFLGAQVDVSGLAKDCVGLESLRRLVEQSEGRDGEAGAVGDKKDEFRDLAEMFNLYELDTVRKHGGTMHRQPSDDTSNHHHNHYHHHHHHQHDADPLAAAAPLNGHRPRILIHDSATSIPRPTPSPSAGPGGRLAGIYEHYLLVRPYPSLRVLFASPSLRVPGMLQSSFLARVGGSQRVRDELTQALADGHGVTARVRWLARPAPQQVEGVTPPSAGGAPVGTGRPRWIHCTPLLAGGAVGVWMVVIVDEDGADGAAGLPAPPRTAPPVDARVGGGGGSRSVPHLRAPPVLDDAASLRSFGDIGGGWAGSGPREAVGGETQRFRGAVAGSRRGRGEAVAGVFDDTRPGSSYSWEIGED